MLMTLALLLLFFLVAGTLWMHGLWGNAITLINLILAMLLATNFYEPVAALAESFVPGGTYFYDFVALWGLFIACFGILRAITDGLSSQAVKFMMPLEIAGRSLLAIWCGWLMVCFTAFSLQMAPLNSQAPLGAWQSPTDNVFMVFAPDRMWAGFMQQNSRGYLSRGHYSSVEPHNDDREANVEAFDPHSEFPYKYAYRRKKYAALDGMGP